VRRAVQFTEPEQQPSQGKLKRIGPAKGGCGNVGVVCYYSYTGIPAEKKMESFDIKYGVI